VDRDLEAGIVGGGGDAGAELGAQFGEVAHGRLPVPRAGEDVVDEDVAEGPAVPVPGLELHAPVRGLIAPERDEDACFALADEYHCALEDVGALYYGETSLD